MRNVLHNQPLNDPKHHRFMETASVCHFFLSCMREPPHLGGHDSSPSESESSSSDDDDVVVEESVENGDLSQFSEKHRNVILLHREVVY